VLSKALSARLSRGGSIILEANWFASYQTSGYTPPTPPPKGGETLCFGSHVTNKPVFLPSPLSERGETLYFGSHVTNKPVFLPSPLSERGETLCFGSHVSDTRVPPRTPPKGGETLLSRFDHDTRLP